MIYIFCFIFILQGGGRQFYLYCQFMPDLIKMLCILSRPGQSQQLLYKHFIKQMSPSVFHFLLWLLCYVCAIFRSGRWGGGGLFSEKQESGPFFSAKTIAELQRKVQRWHKRRQLQCRKQQEQHTQMYQQWRN